MGKSKHIALLVLCFIFSGVSLSAENEMTYVFKNSSFTLTKSCIENMRAATSEIPTVYILNISLKNNKECAEKLNSAITENVGSELSVFYKGVLINKSYIVGDFKTENGFRMTMDNQNLRDEILISYR